MRTQLLTVALLTGALLATSCADAPAPVTSPDGATLESDGVPSTLPARGPSDDDAIAGSRTGASTEDAYDVAALAGTWEGRATDRSPTGFALRVEFADLAVAERRQVIGRAYYGSENGTDCVVDLLLEDAEHPVYEVAEFIVDERVPTGCHAGWGDITLQPGGSMRYVFNGPPPTGPQPALLERVSDG